MVKHEGIFTVRVENSMNSIIVWAKKTITIDSQLQSFEKVCTDPYKDNFIFLRKYYNEIICIKPGES